MNTQSNINATGKEADFLGGYVMFANAYRPYMVEDNAAVPVGADFKEQMSRLGSWAIYTYVQGEVIPIESSYVRLSKDKKDQWGIPQIITSVAYTNEAKKYNKEHQIPHYFMLMKQLTLLVFFTSKQGMIEVLKYNPVLAGYWWCENYNGKHAWV